MESTADKTMNRKRKIFEKHKESDKIQFVKNNMIDLIPVAKETKEKEFVLSDYIQYKDLDDFNCEFIDIKKIRKFIRLLKEEIDNNIKIDCRIWYKEIIDNLAGDVLNGK